MTVFKSSNIQNIKKVIKIMGKRVKTFLIFTFLFCAVELCCTTLYSFGMKEAINGITFGDMNEFYKGIILVMANHVLWWIYAPISSYECAKATKGTMRDFRTDLCEQLLYLPMAYHDNKPRGEIISNLSNDVSALEKIYDRSLFQVLRSISGGLGGVVIMAVIDWRFAMVVFAMGTLCVFVSNRYSKKLGAMGKELEERLSKTTIDIYEFIKAAKTIRLLKIQEKNIGETRKYIEAEADIKMDIGRTFTKMKAMVKAINVLSYIGILFIGALFVYYGLSDWGTVIALMALKNTSDMLFVESGEFIGEMKSNLAMVDKVFNLIEDKRETICPKVCFENMTPAIALRDVCFSYDGETEVIKKFSMKIPKNQITVLIGASGKGKSSIMKLILGLYEPNEGNIFFQGNGEPTLEKVRKKVAYVPQESRLFKGTILENIALGKSGSKRDQIISAAKMAGAHEFICDLPKGYDTMVMDDGKSLSGGQKQRIAIARAMIKDAPILLLDEITASLDKEAEEEIMNTIRKLTIDKTVLMITHKKHIIKSAYQVVNI